MKKITKGKLITTSEIRELLAKKYNVDTACPLTTGIFVNICANASIELNDHMPYWRTLCPFGTNYIVRERGVCNSYKREKE